MLTDDERKTIEHAVEILLSHEVFDDRLSTAVVIAKLRAIAAPRAETAPRCSCTYEAGDSRCETHPSCSECGERTVSNVDDCASHAPRVATVGELLATAPVPSTRPSWSRSPPTLRPDRSRCRRCAPRSATGA